MEELRTAPTRDEPLDAYSEVVTRVADHLLPRVVRLVVNGRGPGAGRAIGTGSAVVITPDQGRHHHVFGGRKFRQKMMKLEYETHLLVSKFCKLFGSVAVDLFTSP
jgi:hypothetical protein